MSHTKKYLYIIDLQHFMPFLEAYYILNNTFRYKNSIGNGIVCERCGMRTCANSEVWNGWMWKDKE